MGTQASPRLSFVGSSGRWLTQSFQEDTNLAWAGFLNSCFTRHGGITYKYRRRSRRVAVSVLLLPIPPLPPLRIYCTAAALPSAAGSIPCRREYDKRLGYISMDKEIITMDRLRPGESAVVEHLEPSPLCSRLRELGLVSGTAVKCLYKSPLGDPQAYSIRGAVIALRREDSRAVYAVRGDVAHGQV